MRFFSPSKFHRSSGGVAFLFLSGLVGLCAPPAAQEPADVADAACEVVVLDFEAKGLAANEAHVAEILTNTFAAEVSQSAGCKVITQSDIKSMTEFDAQRALCGSAESCMAEIGNALGVDIVIGGAVGRLGEAYTLQVMKRNVTKGTVEARVDDTITGGAAALQPAARNAARKVYGLAVESTAAASSNASSTATADTNGDTSGGGGGTALLFSGIGLAGAGAVLMGAGIAVGVLVDALVLGSKDVAGADKDSAALIGLGAVGGGVAVGAIALAGGGALAALGALSE